MRSDPTAVRRPRVPLRAASLALCCCLCCLSSCFTMGLWGMYPETERDAISGREETSFEYDPETEWSWQLFCLRVLLTPVTVALDCITWPIQKVFLEDEDESVGCPR